MKSANFKTTPIGYYSVEFIELFVAGVYLQPLIWMYLYNKRVPIPPWVFQVAGVALAIFIAVFRVGSGFYTPEILLFYTLSVVYCIHYYRGRGGFQPVCLAFLIVFLNSYYWEFPIHVGNLLAGYVGLVLFQSAHLYPLPFLLMLGFKFPPRWWYWSCAAWTVITALSLTRILNIVPVSSSVINLICRGVGLITLTWILRFPGQPESKLIYAVRQVLARHDRASP